MDKKFSCYCGLYCGNCAVKVKIEPAAKVLYHEMKSAGFTVFLKRNPVLENDNALLCDKGWEAWLILQEERLEKGYTYQER